VGLREALDRYEQALLRRALEQAGGIQTSAAETLGISESNLRYKLKKHELER
jgi:DNA-binding NtrC family response regulator